MKTLIDAEVEINEDFLPNSNLTYDIYFDGADTFHAKLSFFNFDKRLVAVEEAPKELVYKLLKPIKSFNYIERKQVLEYRGLEEGQGFKPIDIFMEKSYIKLIEIDGVPYFENDMLTSEIRRAFQHVKLIFPQTSIVVFDIHGRWCFLDANFDGVGDFVDKINIDILENASNSVPHLPYIYQELIKD